MLSVADPTLEPPVINVDVFFPESPFGGVQVVGATETPAQVVLDANSPVTSVFGRMGIVTAQASDYAAFYMPLGEGGAVSSVFGRGGAVVAQEGDYDAFYPNKAVVYNDPSWIGQLSWPKITGRPTTLAGYGITDPVVLTTGSYANPAWITSLAWSKITGAPPPVTSLPWSSITATPTTISGYGITDAQPHSTNLDGWAGKTPYAGNIVVDSGKTVTFNNGPTFSGADGSTISFAGGGSIAYITSGNIFTAAPQTININALGNKGLVIKAFAGQTANLQEWQNSSGVALCSVSQSGVFTGSGAGLTAIPWAAITGAPAFEPALGNPASDGMVLSSTAAGVRSWITPSAAAPVSSVFTRTGAITAQAGDYAAFYQPLGSYEASLGNPSTNGYILSSTTAGVRSWIAPPTGVAFPLLAPNGTAAAPSYSFSAQSGTGIYYNTASGGQITFAMNGTSLMYLQPTPFLVFPYNGRYIWTSGAVSGAGDTGLARNAAGIVEVNNSSPGTFADLKLRNLYMGLQTPAPATPAEGMFYYNSTNHQPYFYNGTAWTALSGGGGGGNVSNVGTPTSGQLAQWTGATTIQGVAATPALVGAEPALGNPAADGYVLSSTAAGIRSWLSLAGYAPLASPTFTGTLTCANLNCTGTILRPNAIQGVIDGSNAAAGNVGEFLSAVQSVTLTIVNATRYNVISLTLAAGDWDVRGGIYVSHATAAAATNDWIFCRFSTTSQDATLDAYSGSAVIINPTATAFSLTAGAAVPTRRFSFAATTTVYLVVNTWISGTGTVTLPVNGSFMEARRVR